MAEIKDYRFTLSMMCLFIIVQSLALFLTSPMHSFMTSNSLQYTTDPNSMSNAVQIIFSIIFVTLVVLLAIKLKFQWFIALIQYIFTALILGIIFYVLLGFVSCIGNQAIIIATVFSIVVTAVLFLFPEWYVIDLTGILETSAIVVYLGSAFSICPVLAILAFTAVEDYIAVYKTKHMQVMVSGMDIMKYSDVKAVTGQVEHHPKEYYPNYNLPKEYHPNDKHLKDYLLNDKHPKENHPKKNNPSFLKSIRIPLSFIIPKQLPYSVFDVQINPDGTRKAINIGFDDLTFPSLLVVSAKTFMNVHYAVAGAMIGTLIGVIGLMHLTSRRRMHAGLPFLNTGAIIGCLVGLMI
jgi:presenilin-like A22 family membrane protease